MELERTEIRDDILAILAAARDLPPDADGALADTLLDRLERTMSRPGDTAQEGIVLPSRARLGLAGVAAVLIVTVPIVEWAGSHTVPEPGYLAGWLIVIAIAIILVAVAALGVIRDRTHPSAI